MSRYIGPVCRLCRREGVKLFLKGARCQTEKCAFERRGYAPGMHRQTRGKKSEYCVQLREKQKVRRLYRLQEGQFRNTFKKAAKMKGVVGENLLQLLERRLDSVVYRMGFAASRDEARQMIRHNHIHVNGKRVNIPSFISAQGDIVSVVESSKDMLRIQAATKMVTHVPAWLEASGELTYKIIAFPEREDITTPIQEQLIVELYSR